MENIHGPQLQRHRTFIIYAGCRHKVAGDFGFRRAQYDPGPPLAFGLSLPAHGVLQFFGNDNVPDLHRLHRNSPGNGPLVDHILQNLVQNIPAGKNLRQHGVAHYRPQSGLGRPRHSLSIIFDLQRGLFRVPYHPEQNGVHIDRHSILGQRLLGNERGGHHPLIDPVRHGINERDHPKISRPLKAPIFAQPQNHRFFPFRRNFHRHADANRNQQGCREQPDIAGQIESQQTATEQRQKQNHRK